MSENFQQQTTDAAVEVNATETVPSCDVMGYPQGDSIHGLAEQVATEQARAEDRIPRLQDETLTSLRRKNPSFFAYLLGEQVIPSSVEPTVKRERGRPKKHVPEKTDRIVHKIEHQPAKHKVIADSIRLQVRKDVAALRGFGVIESCRRVAARHNLSYDQVYHLTRDLF